MLLIADEPTTALDPTTRLGILDLLRAGADRRATIFVTHDLGSAARICTHLAVIYAGRIVESGPAAALLRAPLHPYTRALLDAFPRLGGAARPRPIPGQVIPPDARGAGCSFAPRCPRAMPACAAAPTLATHGDRLAACHAAGAAA
jgi:peptide/nickel transport system ATP-binding protein